MCIRDRSGYGVLTSNAAGTQYKGEWKDNQYNGAGELTVVLNRTAEQVAVYTGTFEDGDMTGFGTHRWEQARPQAGRHGNSRHGAHLDGIPCVGILARR